MHVVTYLPVTHRSSQPLLGRKCCLAKQIKAAWLFLNWNMRNSKKSLLQMHLPLGTRIKFSDLASESQRAEACVNIAWELQYWPCCEALNQEPGAPSWTYFKLECVPQQYEPSKCMANFSPLPQPVFTVCTAVTFAHIKIIALLWKTEPDLNATFINFTNTKRLLNMRQVFVNMTSRRLW